MYVLNDFFPVHSSWRKNIFGTFCVQIDQLFESQWAFEIVVLKENVADLEILPNVQRLTVPLIIDQFGRKRCQKKRKDLSYQLLQEFFQKYFVVHELWAGKNSFSTYFVCYTLDFYFGE